MKRFSFTLGATALVAVAAQPASAAQAVSAAALGDQIHEAFDVSDYTLQRLELSGTLSDGFATRVVLGGRTEFIQGAVSSVRAPDHRVLVDRGAEQFELFDAPAPVTFRGTIAGDKGSIVAGTLVNGQLNALAWRSDGSTWAIQPLSELDATVDPAVHVVFDAKDSMPGDYRCIELDSPDLEQTGGVILGTGIRWSELAFDSDVEFYNKNGMSVTNTINDIELIMSLVNVIYERDVNIHFDVATIIVRTVEPDPYTTTDPSALLNQFRSHWTNTKSFIKRDTAHMMTGKNLAGSVIGIAFLGVICSNSSGFGLSESRFTFNLNMRAGLTAHEVGHNYNAQHCSGPSCFIMCAGLGGCGGDVTKFGAGEQTQIENYSATRACTPELAPPLTAPWTDNFDAASVDNSIWPSLQGALTSTGATGEISGTMSLNLDTVNAEPFADDYVRSNYVLLAGESGLALDFYTEHVGVEAGETLTVEYLASNGDWQTAVVVTSDGSNQASFQHHSFNLPANAYHDEFRVGIRVDGSSADDDWYVDDFGFGGGCADPLNYCVGAANSVGFGAVMTWVGSTSVAANDLVLEALFCPPGQTGIFFYGPNQTQVAFGNGFMCVSGGITRLPVQTIDVFGQATHNFDVTGTGINVGSTEQFQFWYRDPMGGGAFFNLSDGLSTIWCP